MDSVTLPVLDFITETDDNLVAHLLQSAQQYSFFYIKHPNFPDEDICKYLQLARSFFDLPAKVKDEVLFNENTDPTSGFWCGFYRQVDNPTAVTLGEVPDVMESFSFGSENKHSRALYYKLLAEEPRLSSNKWPAVGSFQKEMLECFAKLN